MAVFSVKPQELLSGEEALQEVLRQSRQLMEELRETAENMAGSGSCEADFSPAVRSIASKAESITEKVSRMGSALEVIAGLYESAENAILSSKKSKSGASGKISKSGAGSPEDDLPGGEWSRDKVLFERSYGEGTKKSTKPRAGYTRKNALYETGKSFETSGEYWSGSYEGQYGKVKAEVGKAEAYGSVKAGLYRIGDDDKQVLAPVVQASAGGSVSALTLSAAAKVGNETIGAFAKGSASVGKAEGKVRARAEFMDKDGSFSPKLSANASAEAIAVEATGEASGRFLGIEGTVKAGVNVGIGAHADFGYENGKIRCDIGASLGLGASIGMELDLSEAVKAVCSGARAFFEWLFA